MNHGSMSLSLSSWWWWWWWSLLVLGKAEGSDVWKHPVNRGSLCYPSSLHRLTKVILVWAIIAVELLHVDPCHCQTNPISIVEVSLRKGDIYCLSTVRHMLRFYEVANFVTLECHFGSSWCAFEWTQNGWSFNTQPWSPWGECANPACQHLLEMWRCLQECVWCSPDYFPAEAWTQDLSAFPASQPQTKPFLNLPGVALRESQVWDHLQIWCGIRWELGTCCCGFLDWGL